MPDLQRRILLVEDEESLILTLQDRLESEGYAVTVARDGEAALDAGSRNGIDAACRRRSSCSPRAAS
jgi:DNA-binding response OmpR family regulator